MFNDNWLFYTLSPQRHLETVQKQRYKLIRWVKLVDVKSRKKCWTKLKFNLPKMFHKIWFGVWRTASVKNLVFTLLSISKTFFFESNTKLETALFFLWIAFNNCRKHSFCCHQKYLKTERDSNLNLNLKYENNRFKFVSHVKHCLWKWNRK